MRYSVTTMDKFDEVFLFICMGFIEEGEGILTLYKIKYLNEKNVFEAKDVIHAPGYGPAAFGLTPEDVDAAKRSAFALIMATSLAEVRNINPEYKEICAMAAEIFQVIRAKYICNNDLLKSDSIAELFVVQASPLRDAAYASVTKEDRFKSTPSLPVAKNYLPTYRTAVIALASCALTCAALYSTIKPETKLTLGLS